MKNTVMIIAEAGVNHNGDMALAYQLIDRAAEAGADVIKFQTFKASDLVTKSADMAGYQVENTKKSESQYEMLKRLELSHQDFRKLKSHAQAKGIRFLSTGFDPDSLEFLRSLEMGLWKIPSGEITNRPFLEFVGRQKEEVILSTGMATIHEVEQALLVLEASGTPRSRIVVLHCTTDYPTMFEDVNLRAMSVLAEKLQVVIGYSDHTPGIEVPIAAVALGARVIEKHFTIDKNLPGPDHKASLDPQELAKMVVGIRNIEKAMGLAEKRPSSRESENMKVIRKSLVAKTEIKAGEVFQRDNLAVKRPGTGISPMRIAEVCGQKAKRTFLPDELIEL